MNFPKYEFHEYPKWVYSPSAKAKIVQTEEEEEALGSGWFTSKAEADAAAVVKVAPGTAPKAGG
jgi:hypothetical protein